MLQDFDGPLELLRWDADLALYRACPSGAPSVLLLVAERQPRAESLERLAHEHALRGVLEEAWSARPLELTQHDGRAALVLEDAGEPLERILERTRGKPVELSAFLRLAAELAAALAQVHRRGLIHKDISPAHVLVDDAGQPRLTGFGIASRLRSERQAPGPPESIAGTLAYMAPEQTGRMNRSIDARSDLYSLGVVLYELLTHALPFTTTDPMELIHCHVARQPPAPSDGVRGLPATIDRIVLKLLGKNPEDRYRTAAGVEADLRACLDLWLREGRIDGFELGRHDASDRLLLPEKLYGREREIDSLLSAFERVATSSVTQLVLVSGYAGVGKSSIVNELQKLLLVRRGMFAAGKFDQYKRDIPYATVAQAFQSLVRQLLSKSDLELSVWREELLAALGAYGQLMVNLIPELSLVIGEPTPLPPVEPQAAQARFQLVFRNLLRVFGKPERPLVLFIDDLQWLDAGTLQLLARLVTDPDVRDVLFVGAYRDNEVGADHPLSSTIAAIRAAGGKVSSIALEPLRVEHLAQLCADALDTQASRTRHLAELLSEKTGGNPFFVLEFISALAEDGLFAFDAARGVWHWDMARIRAKGITDNVAELVSAKLSRLSAPTRAALGQLACLGNSAEIHTLALLRDGDQASVQADLREAVEAGVVLRRDGSVAFTHDRLQEAAYALVPPSTRAEAHLQIGRKLLALTAAAELEEKIFELVHQYDAGAAALDSTAERDAVAALYLTAGKRARTSSARASAQRYLRAGRALLAESAWQRQYRLTFELEIQLAECEIVLGEMASAEQRLETLSEHASSVGERAAVVCLAVLLFFSIGKSERAVEIALAFLPSVGISWSKRSTEVDVRQEYMEMQRRLALRPIASLIDLPAMSDPNCIATMAVLTELFPAAYAVDRYLLELVLLRMTNLSLAHGNCESSPVAYSALNMALGDHFADYPTAFGLGQLACELVDRRGADRYKARVYSCFAAFAMPWIKHVALCRPLMTQAFEMGSSMGDTAFALYNSRNLITHLLISGLPLPHVQREAEQVKTVASGVQLGLPIERFIRQLELIRKLRGVPAQLAPDDDWAKQAGEIAPQLAMMVCYHWVFRLEERYFAGDIPGALDAAARVDGIRWAMRSSIEEAEYDFYAALAHAAAAARGTPQERESHLQTLLSHYARIWVWASNCPDNFDNRKALIGAEIARIQGHPLEAEASYEDAIRLARRHGFVQNEALASELAGQFYAARGLGTSANAHLAQARRCYERWGALIKVKQLDARHPQLRAGGSGLLTARLDTPVAQLDVETVDKASQTLSSEMAVPSLLEKLMRLAVEHAGAERGLLILLQDDVPHIEAEVTTARGSVEVTVRRAPVTPSELPQSALQYVLRTRERVVLDDASVEGLLSSDEYVLRRRPKSVLCLPVFKRERIVGALYLENNLTSCAFAADRVRVLDFLASQAAISLENARLYSELQRSAALLKEAQHLSSTGSFYWRVALDTLEFSEQTFRTYDLDPTEPVTLAALFARTHPEDRALLQELIDVARGPATDLDYTYRIQLPDLSVRHLHLVAHGARDEGGQLEYIGAIQDVTQRHLAEQALERARSELAHVARVTTLGALTASIAHEVSQPLSGIVTNSSACLRMLGADPPNVEGARETVRRTIRDGSRAADVIRRLRALFGNQGSSSEPVDLNEAAKEVLTLSWNELQRNRIVTRTELAPDLPPLVADRVQLQQVILNLLLNAADAMSGVDDRARQLLIKTQLEPSNRVRLSVRDAGVGLDVANVDKLFEAFYSTKANGMGMGLSVSRSIIESHHGRLWAEANRGPGAMFSFSIPVSPEARDA